MTSRRFISLHNVRMDTTTKYRCEQCAKVFTMKKNLTSHVRCVHDQVKKHECSVCLKKFARKGNKELHYKTCWPTVGFGLPSLKELRSTTSIALKPRLLQSAHSGNAAAWTIDFPNGTIDPLVSLTEAAKAMKATIFEHSYMNTYQLKFYFALHIIFHKATDPNVFTEPPVVLQTDPATVLLANLFDLDEIFQKKIDDLLRQIDTFQTNGSGWVIDRLVRLDTHITSFK